MRIFRLALTGDYLDVDGNLVHRNIGMDPIMDVPYIDYDFVRRLAPTRGDDSYWERQYSLLVEPEDIAEIDGLVVLRPWIKRSTFANGAATLTIIGRAGAGYDKLDLVACTDNDVLVFNAPDALVHSTASAALMFMLALAKRLPAQERIARQGRWDLQYSVVGGEIEGATLGIVGLGKFGREL